MHPGWSVPADPAVEERARLSALSRARGGRVLFLLQPEEATPSFRAQLSARGRVREVLRHPQAVAILWEAKEGG